MDSISTQLIELLPAYGPALLFALALLETCFITGLVVPSGVATSIATVLALQGQVDLVSMIVAAGAGGAAGDTIGFWIGRWSGEKVLHGDGPWARRLNPKRDSLKALYGRHPFFSVTVARLISFVRTLMPMSAGMSGLSYRTYLPFELAGLIGWLAIYVGIGVLARESWQIATRIVGVGGTILFLGVGIGMWIVMKRGKRASAKGSDGASDS